MSRGNVFKLSGNMALGTDNYSNDVDKVKNSLRMLKSKQEQKSSQQNYPDYNVFVIFTAVSRR